jgi:ABC-type amino acid transport substrate-binding protein
MSANQPPMNMKNRQGGIMGLDVDLAQALAAAMQVKLEIKTIPFGELMKALEKDEVDMVISGMSITPKRTESVSFVGPYIMSGKSIITRNDVLSNVSSTQEFNRAGLKLVALSNSTSASYVSRVAPQATLIEVATYDDGVKKLLYSEADAMVADMPTCVLAVLRNPGAGFATLDRPLTVEPIGIAISKDDLQFQNLVQNYLRAYEKAGILNKLREKWLEDSSWVSALP